MKLPVFEDMGILLNVTQRRAIADLHELVYHEKIKIRVVDECFCGSKQFKTLSRFDRFGLPFGTKICKACGLISQTLQIHSDSLSIFYEKIYWPLVIGKKFSEVEQDSFVTKPKQSEKNSFLLKYVDQSKMNLSIFEVGCGSGIRIKRLNDELEGLGYDVHAYGCDYSSEVLEQAKLKGISVIQGGFEEISGFGKADILILSHVFEHLPDLNDSMLQISNLLHDDSLLYIEVPGVIDLENKKEYDFNYQVYSVLAHNYNFSLQSLVNVMASGGFRLLAGDEYVRSIFVKGQIDTPLVSAYQSTIDSLKKSYNKQLKLNLRRNQPIFRYIKNVVKSLLNKGVAL